MNKKRWIILGVLLLLGVIWYGYNILMPSSPVLDYVPNPIENRALKTWSEEEEKVENSKLKNAYFGDLHVHTKYSFDAFIGGVSAAPNDAYKFAKGEAIDVLDRQVKIVKPLDFAAVTDHAEYLGEMYSVQHKGVDGYNTMAARLMRGIGRDTAKQRAFFNRMAAVAVGKQKDPTHPDFFRGYSTTSMAWDKIIEAAENHYIPGEFTTFIGYEWSKGDKGAHLHRNVIFKDGVVPKYPLSAFEAKNELELWETLENYRKGGATVMAVPHNSNLSHGLTFANQQPDGSEIDAQYIQTRNRNEPLVEIHQAKGNSEVHPALWQNDEYANFEIYREEENPDPNNFVRHVLKRGLKYNEEYGTNPYEYGLIGSTDSHTGTPGNTEENDEFQGNHLFLDVIPEARSTRPWLLNDKLKTYDAINPGGLVGVWASANTRPEIYKSLKQKETFATSGNRIKVRFFGGSKFEKNFSSYEEMVSEGYAKGVPMGQYLNSPEGNPQFLIWAAKDPEGANLEKVQVIKGWYDGTEMNEEIIDAVITQNPYSSSEDVVDIKTGALNYDYGSATLSTTWTDENFDPNQQAFYYLRVIEVPSLRYTQWDVIRYGIDYPEDFRKTIQDRAWSSPIWYNPNKK